MVHDDSWGPNDGRAAYRTDFTFGNVSGNIEIETEGSRTFQLTPVIFGYVGLVNATVQNGSQALQASSWDCHNCEQFILTCNNHADCGGSSIYCPEDNQRDMREIFCDTNTICDDFDIFTTNWML